MAELSKDERAELVVRLQGFDHPSGRLVLDEVRDGAIVAQTSRGTPRQVLDALMFRMSTPVDGSAHSSLDPLERAASAGGTCRLLSVFGRRYDGSVVVHQKGVLFTWVLPVGREMTPADRRG